MIYLSVVSFAFGLIFEKYLALGFSFALLILLISLCSGLLLFKTRDRAFLILLIGLSFGFGILRMSFADTAPESILLESVGKEISFEATITDEPDIRDTSARYTVEVLQNSSSGQPSKCTDIFLLENSSCSLRRASQGISPDVHSKNFDSLILLVTDRFPEFQYGDQVLVSGKLEQPKNFTSDQNDIEFDYVSYLAKDRIHFLMHRPEIEKIGDGQGNKIIAGLYLIKNKFVENIGRFVPEPNASLLGGIIFGAKQSLGENLLTDFKNVGLIHIVVLSGYNLTIIVTGVLYATSYFGKRKTGFIISVFLLILFSLMVGLGATVIRAAIMAMIAILAKHLGRPSDALRALSIAGFLMLIWNPLSLTHDPSFQLSFMATLGLILFSPIVENFIARQKFQRFFPQRFGIREITASTFAVQLFLLPLLIKMSGTFSLVSFVINLVVLPLIPTLMLFGFATGLLGFLPLIGKFLAWPFGALSYFFSQIIISLTEFSANLPFAFIQTGSLPLWLVILWYFAYAFLFWKLRTRETVLV